MRANKQLLFRWRSGWIDVGEMARVDGGVI